MLVPLIIVHHVSNHRKGTVCHETARYAPLKSQPWYEHCSLPSWMRPSDSATERCGQWSSNARQSLPSCHRTKRWPRMVIGVGLLRSRSCTTAAAYLHATLQ